MITQLIDQVKKLDIPLKEGCNSEDLGKLAKEAKYELPDDFIAFYSSVNGFEDDCSFERQRIWDCERIIAEYLEYNDEFIRFSDFMLNCPWIGISKNNNKIYIGAGYKNEFSGDTNVIANNFSEFLELIISNSDELY